MSVIDAADRLNRQHEAIRKVEEESARQSELRTRKLSYYNEFGRKWFQDISVAIDQLIEGFNKAAGSHSKLARVPHDDSAGDVVAVRFLRPSEKPTEESPTCMLRRNTQELAVTLEIEHARAPYKERYDVAIKNFSEFKVRITTVTEKQSLGEEVQWRDRETGEMHYEPTFVSKKTTNASELNTTEFSDYILSTFAEKML